MPKMINKEVMLNEYYSKLDEISETSLNNDQKELIKDILKALIDQENCDEEKFVNAYQLLIKRVKTGFVFDIAPNANNTTYTYLSKNKDKSVEGKMSEKNTLIIGENYDALKSLIFIENQREREREREQ
ncbi:type III restriction endonuclease subunit M [Mycoplasma bradburyae]|uniref:Type III restriction endonuclease subunit M n=1 Tax=Mycoplasma bradburyae TaxID=2963128 RepID=A0ABT5GBI8_9MOLU|nr:type III restriction endonuclease subunit M [Mycoplasma bradburyae]MDC4182238.1 type III restriction endonuclease subunit M [Mycoplasma bradburyae]UTS70061.1 type III restriction endonuclease subunit M [Mycoplasma bradburyae]